MFRSPIWRKWLLAPIPPSRFKSINFMYKRLVNTAEGDTGKRGFGEKSPAVHGTADLNRPIRGVENAPRLPALWKLNERERACRTEEA
jgi:hypothetical protein